jgi:MoxR-like ATPase
MEDGRVSIEGRAVDLAQPFMVLATRNPIEFHGTFPVPEAALDRFIARVEIGYPQLERELQLYRGDDAEHLLAAVTPVISIEQLQAAQAQVDRIAVSEPVARYCHAVVAATRVHREVLLGASPRAALAWLRAAKARAWLHARDYVLPDDLKALCRSVLGHRVFMQGGASAATLVAQLVEQTAVPV